MNFPGPQKASSRRRLLAWYDAHARDLPWRRTRDPYAIWVSEIMLQQTRVAAVLEHYRVFLNRFPTLQALARAKEAQVLAAWSGLGYYRRARMLHAAAQKVMREFAGEIPHSASALIELPGIGRYTSAAIASIAFGEATAVVDGNVERVLERLAGKKLSGEKIWKAANELLAPLRPGDFNQAMMELGATVCLPREPLCLACPIRNLCATRGRLAASAKLPAQRKCRILSALSHRNESVFLRQRGPDVSLMAGMWELPELTGMKAGALPLFSLHHSITVTDYTVEVWGVEGTAGTVLPESLGDGSWIPKSKLHHTALTGLARKILVRAGILAKIGTDNLQ